MEFIYFFVKNYKIILLILAFSFIFVLTYRITRLARESTKGFKEIFTLDGFIIFLIVFAVGSIIYFIFKSYIF